jgi:hypothetical protein
MLRFIIKRDTFDETNHMRRERHYTLDLDVPELEQELTRGGYGESGHDISGLMAVEVLPPNAAVHGRDHEHG